MTQLPGLGPKRARRLYEELGIDSLDALQGGGQDGRVSELKGFGPRPRRPCLRRSRPTSRPARPSASCCSGRWPWARSCSHAIRAHPATESAELAGSARRMAESVKDLDIVATATDPAALATRRGGAAAGRGRLEPRRQRGEAPHPQRPQRRPPVVEPDQFGNVLQHLTGSKQHNVALRDLAVRRGLHISEYGVLDDATGITHRCPTEEEVYALLGMAYIEPELRENRGELEAALERDAAAARDSVADLRGDLHSHTTASDGTASIEEMAQAAQAAGYQYLAITDHSASMGFGADVSPDELRRQIERIRSAEVRRHPLLAGSEVNILPDGSLDYPDELLAELDWVVASVHTSFRMRSEEMTARIVRAIEHPSVDCIGHLSGRKIVQRPPYEFDFDAILDAAARTGTMLEINSNPDRRDLERAARSRRRRPPGSHW